MNEFHWCNIHTCQICKHDKSAYASVLAEGRINQLEARIAKLRGALESMLDKANIIDPRYSHLRIAKNALSEDQK